MSSLAPFSAALLTLVLATPARAQLVETWVQSESSFSAGSVGADAAGRTAITGTNSTTWIAHVLVREADGTTAWSRTLDLGPTTWENFGRATFAANGDLIIFGSVQNEPSSPFRYEVLLARYDAAGNLLASRTLPPAVTGGFTQPTALLLAENGDILVGGSSIAPTLNEDATLWRLDAGLNLLWTAYAAGVQSRPDSVTRMAWAPNGDVWIAGAANNYPTVNSDVLVARFTAAGAPLFVREYSQGNGQELPSGLVVDAQGGAYVAASVVSAPSYDAAVLRYDAAGNLLWSRTTGFPTAYGGSLVLDARGDVVHAAQTRDASLVPGYALQKFAAAGNLIWSSTRVATKGMGLLADGDDLVVHGYVHAPYPYQDAFAARYDRHGALRWTWSQGLPGAGGSESIRQAFFAPDGGILAFDGTAFVSSVRLLSRSSRAVCLGDGLGTACPCGNASATIDRAGCRNSLGLAARLDDAGVPRLSADTLRLDVTGVPDTSVLFFQGSGDVAGGAGAVFGDGLRCAGGAVIRIGTRSAVGGSASYPAAGEPSISARGLVPGPGRRWYQAWYRNSAAFCTPSTFNLSNALRVDWAG